jgi:hypothetical protein
MRRSTRITGSLSIASLVVVLIAANSMSSAQGQGVSDRTQGYYQQASDTPDTAVSEVPVKSEIADAKPKPKDGGWKCDNSLAKRLYQTGFRGTNIVEAWAIIMRESGGREDAISATGDYGVFQFNRAAHSGQPWWNTEKMLTWEYNMQIGYEMSQGGRTWYPWDISGRGEHLSRYSSSGTFAKFREWYGKFPCELPGVSA